MKLDHIAVIDNMFNDAKWQITTDKDKKDNFFMCQRSMSIAYPQVAHTFNKNGINQSQVMDYWRNIMKSNFRSKPSWLFTKKDPTKSILNIEKLKKFDKDVIIDYINKEELSTKDFTFKIENHIDEVVLSIKKMQQYKDLKNDK